MKWQSGSAQPALESHMSVFGHLEIPNFEKVRFEHRFETAYARFSVPVGFQPALQYSWQGLLLDCDFLNEDIQGQYASRFMQPSYGPSSLTPTYPEDLVEGSRVDHLWKGRGSQSPTTTASPTPYPPPPPNKDQIRVLPGAYFWALLWVGSLWLVLGSVRGSPASKPTVELSKASASLDG